MGDFTATISEAYATEGAAIDLGRGVHDGELATDAVVQVPLRMMNRHGLVAGATGTGKTITLQTLAEQLSDAGVAVFAADVKGDVSGISVPASPAGPPRSAWASSGSPSSRRGFPVEYLSLGGIGPGVPVRATVSDFGPQLLAQDPRRQRDAGAEPRARLPLRRPEGPAPARPPDLRALLTFLDSDAGKEELEGIGGLASSTVGVLLRALVGLETGGGTEFFGEPQLDIADLLRTAPDGRGVISCLELPAVQDKPRLFSTALMWLVAELFEQLPEAGDLDKPKLVFFFDEAHLLFNDATKAFLESVAQTVRLIRSKGVGVFFVTQVPDDVPGDVLGQLGNRVQHALRAFTPDDAKALKAAASTYPSSDFYDHRGAAHADGDRRGGRHDPRPRRACRRPVVHTRLRAPASRMGPADDVEGAAKASPLYAKYGDPHGRRERAREAGRAHGRGSTGPSRPPQSPGRPPAERAQAPAAAPTATEGRRRGRHRRLPHLARGQGAPEEGDARGVRDAEEAAVSRADFVPGGVRCRLPSASSESGGAGFHQENAALQIAPERAFRRRSGDVCQ